VLTASSGSISVLGSEYVNLMNWSVSLHLVRLSERRVHCWLEWQRWGVPDAMPGRRRNDHLYGRQHCALTLTGPCALRGLLCVFANGRGVISVLFIRLLPSACCGTPTAPIPLHSRARSFWRVRPAARAPGQAVSFRFSSFSTELNYDYVYFYNGPDTSSPLLASARSYRAAALLPAPSARGCAL